MITVVDVENETYEYLNSPRIQTVAEWELIIKSELERQNGFDFISRVLVEMYKRPNHTIFCREFEQEHNIGGLNLRLGEFRDRIRKIEGIRFPEQIREDSGTDRAWNIPFKSSEELNSQKENTGKFCWILRDELIEAMENVMPYIREFRREYSKQFAPIEFHDIDILRKPVDQMDSQAILDRAAVIHHQSSDSCQRRYPGKIDYISKQSRNKLVGDSGEQKVVQLEKEKLKELGKADLAKKVHIVDSDAYGYDIESFDENGNPKHIEVKTTTQAEGAVRFHISAHEVDVLMTDNAYELHYLFCVKEKLIKRIVFTAHQLREELLKKYMRPTQYVVEFDIT